MKKLINYFTKGELILWGVSVIFILVSFLIFDRVNFLTLSASLIGFGQILDIKHTDFLSDFKVDPPFFPIIKHAVA